MDAFDALKAIRYQASKTGSSQRRRQNSSPKGAFTVSQYLDNQSALYHPDVEAKPEEEATCAVQMALPVTQGESSQLVLPIASIEQNDLLSKRLKPADKPKHVQDEQPGKDLCWDKPQLKPIHENAYRILGLPSSADSQAILKRGDELKLQVKLGKPFQSAWDLSRLGPVERNEATIQEALWRLSDPALRIKARLYWPTDKLQGTASRFEDTSDWVEELVNEALNNPKLQHDLALGFLITSCQTDLEESLKTWKFSMLNWKMLVSEDGFWDWMFAQESQGGFLRSATLEDIEELRSSCLLQMSEGMISQARQSLIDKDDKTLERILETVESVKLPKPVCEQIEQSVFGFMKTDIENLYDDVLAENYRQDAMNKLKKELLPLYGRVSKFMKPESRLLQQIQETVLQCFYRILTLWAWSGDELDFLFLRKEARRIAPPDSLVLPRIELLIKGCRNE